MFGARMPTDMRGRIRTNSFALASILGLFACVVLGSVFDALGAGWHAWIMGGGVLAIVGVIVRHRHHGHVEHSLFLLLTVFFSLIAFYTYSLGGIRSAGACWFIVPPFVAMLCSMRHATLGWSAAGAAALGVMYELEIGGHDFHLMAGAGAPTLYLVSLLLVSLLLLGFLTLLGHSRDRTMAYLERTNQELCVTRDAALAAAKAKVQFLANMSHEIRTPLNGVLGMAELLNSSRLDVEQRRFLKTLHHSGEHLLRLIDDILDFSKLEAGGIKLEPGEFSPRDLVAHLVEAMKVEASAKGLALTAAIADDVPDLVLGDAARVRQILFNLVANAIKFTPAGSVGIALRRVQDASAGVVLEFEVRDTGIGIDAADLARLFTAFAQADGSTTRPFGGIGLGLAISQELARQMHGGLHIDSVVGEGTCARCTLWFDACEPRAQAGAAPAAVEGAATGPSVLLVEDNPVNLEVGIAMLEQLGCRITVAHDGAEALTHWRGACHDLVLMDCQMPVMDGFAATREMRAEEGGLGRLRTPIVALTANVFREDRDACFAAGMDDFLAKPYTLAQLREVIERHRHQARAA